MYHCKEWKSKPNGNRADHTALNWEFMEICEYPKNNSHVLLGKYSKTSGNIWTLCRQAWNFRLIKHSSTHEVSPSGLEISDESGFRLTEAIKCTGWSLDFLTQNLLAWNVT